MTKKHTWSESAKSGLIQFPDKPKTKEDRKPYTTPEERTANQAAMIVLAKQEMNGRQIADKLGMSHFYVTEVMRNTGSLVWLDHQELINLRSNRKRKNRNQ